MNNSLNSVSRFMNVECNNLIRGDSGEVFSSLSAPYFSAQLISYVYFWHFLYWDVDIVMCKMWFLHVIVSNLLRTWLFFYKKYGIMNMEINKYQLNGIDMVGDEYTVKPLWKGFWMEGKWFLENNFRKQPTSLQRSGFMSQAWPWYSREVPLWQFLL